MSVRGSRSSRLHAGSGAARALLPCCRGVAWLRDWRTMGPSFRRLRTKQTCPTRLSDCSWHFVARASLIIARPPWEACPVQQDDGDSAERVRHGRAGTAVFSVTSERALGPFGKRLRRYVPRRIVRRRHLCASVKCRMDARHQGECPLEQVPYSFRIDWPRSLSLRACSQPIAETAPIGAYRRLARARSPFRGPRKDI